MRTRTRRVPRASVGTYTPAAPTSGPLRYSLERAGGGALIQRFRSYFDLLDTAENGATDMEERSSRKVNASAFNDASTFEIALDRARCGWPENTKRLRELAASLTHDVMQTVAVTEFRRCEDDGIGVDIDSYLMGEPDCLLRHVEVTPPGQEGVRIVLNACVSWNVEPEVLQAKGAAVVALANALQAAGRRVEIVVAAAIDAKVGHGHLETYFPAKREGEPMQLDTLAFAVASGDVFRRMVFAAWETLSPSLCTTFGIHRKGGYGRVSELRHHGNAHIVIGSGANVAWTNPEVARGWVLTQLTEQRVEFASTAA